MSFEWETNGENIAYECLRCGGLNRTEDLSLRGGHVKCIHCGYRVLRKIKPPVVKRVMAV